MGSVVSTAIDVLNAVRMPLGPGLSSTELANVEHEFGIEFSVEHAQLLGLVMPMGPGWVDWLGDPDRIRRWLSWPLDGVLYDVEQNAFWPDIWGARPDEMAAALRVARKSMQLVPPLIPLYAHRYVLAGQAPEGSPVFSVYQTEVIYYGRDLAAFFAAEFLGQPDSKPPIQIDFWSDLAQGQWL